MCKHGGTEGETRERALQGKKGGRVFRTYHEWQKCEHGGKEGFVKYSNTSTLTYASKTWA